MNLRSDRLASLYLFHPLQRRRSRKRQIPILMYHGISRAPGAARHPYFGTVTAPPVFERHMRLLSEGGYKSVTLSDAVALLRDPLRETAKTVVITFDDGLQDFYSEAFPVLSKYRLSATVFLPTAYIGDTARDFQGNRCLTWGQVRELHGAGMQFGSHTVTHPQLRNLQAASVREEIQRSKHTIEDRLSDSVQSFSYPYAFPEADRAFRRRLRDLLEESGYRNGVSTIIGTASRGADRYFMQRLPANSSDDLPLFRAKLEGGYNWLRSLQYVSKLLK